MYSQTYFYGESIGLPAGVFDLGPGPYNFTVASVDIVQPGCMVVLNSAEGASFPLTQDADQLPEGFAGQVASVEVSCSPLPPPPPPMELAPPTGEEHALTNQHHCHRGCHRSANQPPSAPPPSPPAPSLPPGPATTRPSSLTPIPLSSLQMLLPSCLRTRS